MYSHQKKGLENAIKYFKKEEKVIAVILGGSIAHGYYNEKSDVDIMIVVTPEEYERRKKINQLTYYSLDFTDYEGGYVDGKFLTIDMMEGIRDNGNEPFRYAFKDSSVVFSNDKRVYKLVEEIPMYPRDKRESNIERFYAQIEAWKWYYYEGEKRGNEFLMTSSISNFVIFVTRIILAQNERIYPYQKWMIEELKKCEKKPCDIIEDIDKLVKMKSADVLEKIFNDVASTIDDSKKDRWADVFHRDVEITWMKHEPYISDI